MVEPMKAMAVLAALRANIEGHSYLQLQDGEFYDVYLDNAHAEVPHMSPYGFRACLSELSKRGFYKPIDGYAWGKVKFA